MDRRGLGNEGAKQTSRGGGEEGKDKKDEYQYIDISFPNKFQVEIQYKVLDNEEKMCI